MYIPAAFSRFFAIPAFCLLTITAPSELRAERVAPDHAVGLVQLIATEKPEWGKYFEGHTKEGSIAVYEFKSGKSYAYNSQRTLKQFSAASTFKIPNSMISLETGAIKDVDNDIVKWDGKKRWLEEWNKDHTLRSAFKASAVPVYQELARRIGRKKMDRYVKEMRYGNMDTSGETIDMFWLDNTLKISAWEQINFLNQLYNENLPNMKVKSELFSDRTYKLVKDIMLNEEGKGWKLRGKTGWAKDTPDETGWYVGWLETEKETYIFALNMQMPDMKELQARKDIAKEILSELSGVKFGTVKN